MVISACPGPWVACELPTRMIRRRAPRETLARLPPPPRLPLPPPPAPTWQPLTAGRLRGTRPMLHISHRQGSSYRTPLPPPPPPPHHLTCRASPLAGRRDRHTRAPPQTSSRPRPASTPLSDGLPRPILPPTSISRSNTLLIPPTRLPGLLTRP